MEIKKYLLGGIIGAGLIFGIQTFAGPLPVISKDTIGGAYTLLLGKLDYIQRTIEQVQNTCAKK